jgi:hypothetical protein
MTGTGEPIMALMISRVGIYQPARRVEPDDQGGGFLCAGALDRLVDMARCRYPDHEPSISVTKTGALGRCCAWAGADAARAVARKIKDQMRSLRPKRLAGAVIDFDLRPAWRPKPPPAR